MSNAKGIEKENSARKKILKKAAMLATVASITGACAVGGQKPKESEALIGAIIAAITTVVSIGASIGQSVSDGVQASNERAAAEEEARRQAEEARRQAEEERIRAALESAEHNVRLNKTEESAGKTIDMSSADNSAVLEQQQQEAMARARRRSNIKRPTAPPKDVNIGGFGVEDEEEIVNDNFTGDTEVSNEVLEDNSYDQEENNNDYVTDDQRNGDIDQDYMDNQVEDVDYEEDTDVNDVSEREEENNNSNVIKFNLNELGIDSNVSSKLNYDNKNKEIEGFDIYTDDEGYVEFDESMLMLESDAEEHLLVKTGMLTAEELILLDFGVRSGAITIDILDTMYESGDISDEYYEGAVRFIEDMN